MTSELSRIDWGRLTADPLVIQIGETTTGGNTQGGWIRSPQSYSYRLILPQPISYVSSPPSEIISNWDELQMGEGVQRQISNAVEESAILNRPLNPGGDSAIRKLL